MVRVNSSKLLVRVPPRKSEGSAVRTNRLCSPKVQYSEMVKYVLKLFHIIIRLNSSNLHTFEKHISVIKVRMLIYIDKK